MGTEHLLLGLLREKGGVAAEVLQELGLDIDNARAQVLKVLGYGPRFRSQLPPDPRRETEEVVIQLRDGNDAVRARLAFTRDSQPCLSLLDQEGRERIALKLDADGSPRLEMRDTAGNVVFSAP